MLLFISTIILFSLIGFLSYRLNLSFDLALYQPWLSIIGLVIGLWLFACGLFFHSGFAKAIGTGQQSPLAIWFGPKGARLFFLIVGLLMVVLQTVNLLL